MRKIRNVLLLLPIFFAMNSGAESNQPSAKQVEALIQSSGLEMQINQIPMALQQAGRSQSGPASAFVQPLMTNLLTVFKPEAMLAILRQDLIKRLDTSTLLAALNWYGSPNGKAVINAQKSILQPEIMQEVAQALVKQNVNITQERTNLLRKISASTHANDIALDMMVNMQAAFMSGLSTMIAPAQAQSFEELRISFESSKGAMKAQLEQQLLLQQAVVLKDLSDDLLVEFLDFANSAEGQKLFMAVNASLNHTFQTVARDIPKAMQSSTL